MSHFIIWSMRGRYLGTPKGQASTQMEQPTQRDCSADCTTPSAVFLMASAGQAAAQAGSSQCMQTTGTVWVDVPRSTYSTWIIDSPRWVPHSAQAAMQALHPMQRSGSRKNSMEASIT